MGLLTGGLNGRRYVITDELPDGFRETYKAAIQQSAFVAAPDASDAEPVFGWVDVKEPANTEFEQNTFLYDRYLVLGMRTDKKAVNGRYFKIALAERFEQVKELRAVDKLSKTEKSDIEETLSAELHQRALPSVATADLVWDTQTGQVILFQTSDSVIERMTGLFESTFDVRLRPERMVDWLTEKLARNEVITRAERFLPGARGDSGTGEQFGNYHQDDPLEGVEHELASDFLTWLWLQSEASDGHFRVIEPGNPGVAVGDEEQEWNDVTETLTRADLTLWLEGKLKLVDIHAAEAPDTTILLGVAPTMTPAARSGLHDGKRPVEVKMGMKLGDLEIAMTLMATEFGVNITGLKIPFEVKKGDEEKVFERMGLLDLVHSTLKKLFQQYFLDRTSEVWESRVEKWMEEEDA